MSFKSFALKLLCVCLIPVCLQANEEINIHLIDQAIVQAPEVTLGEIATIEGSEEAKAQLKDVFLAWAPEISRKGSISSYRIKALLDKEGFENAQVHGMQSTFTTDKKVIEKDDVKNMVTEWIQGELPNGTEASLTFKGMSKDWNIPSGDDVEIRMMLQGGSISSSTMVLMEALIDGKVMSSKRVRFDVTLERDVVTFTRPIKRGDIITKDAVSIEKKDITRLKGMEIASLDSVLGMVIKRTTRVGSVLTINDIEKPVLVEKGALTSIIVKNGPINMTITGAEAMINGREGDLVTFKNPMNPRTTLQARVMGKDTAQIIIR